MDLAVIVLLRNEADIFPAFAQHLAALFDRALFLDHNSTDGTTALIEHACQDRPNWQRWHVDIPGFYQALFTTFALRHIFATTPADAVVLLDADEFIDIRDRAALHALIGDTNNPRRVPCLAWRNAVPQPLTAKPLQFGDELLLAPEPSIFRKVIVTRGVVAAAPAPLAMTAGNHMIDSSAGQPLDYETAGEILHVPLRSLEQMRRKTIMGALGHLGRTDRLPHEGYHRFGGLRRIQQGSLTEEDLIGWAANYGHAGAERQPSTFAALLQAGFSARPLDVAYAGAPLAAPPLPATPWEFIAGLLLSWRPAPASAVTLVLNGTRLTQT
jgi:hypothetical protein